MHQMLCLWAPELGDILVSLLLNPSTRYGTAKSNTTRECQSLKALGCRDSGRLIITTQLSQADLASKKCICVKIICEICMWVYLWSNKHRFVSSCVYKIQTLCLYATRSCTMYRQGFLYYEAQKAWFNSSLTLEGHSLPLDISLVPVWEGLKFEEKSTIGAFIYTDKSVWVPINHILCHWFCFR